MPQNRCRNHKSTKGLIGKRPQCPRQRDTWLSSRFLDTFSELYQLPYQKIHNTNVNNKYKYDSIDSNQLPLFYFHTIFVLEFYYVYELKLRVFFWICFKLRNHAFTRLLTNRNSSSLNVFSMIVFIWYRFHVSCKPYWRVEMRPMLISVIRKHLVISERERNETIII